MQGSIKETFFKAHQVMTREIRNQLAWLFSRGRADEVQSYCYPPLSSGIPALPVSEILSYPDTRKKMANIMALLATETRGRCEEIIHRYAAFVHLLPASEAHHHRGAGGLLAHGLEVGLYTLQRAYERLYGMEMEPRQRRLARPRWQLCCLVAGLCHDLGKPAAIIRVTNGNGEIWEPFGSDLFGWCQESGSERYWVTFRKHKQDDHEKLSMLALDRVITEEDRRYFSEYDPDMMLNLLKAVQNSPDAGHEMCQMLRRADSRSVKEDIENSNLAQDLGPQTGLPNMRIYLDAMRRLLGEGSWKVNEPGSRLWLLDSRLYLVWPEGGKDMAEMLNREPAYQGVPRNPAKMLEIMSEWRFNEPSPGGSPYWWIHPEMLSTRLCAIRIREAGALLEILPLSAPGSVEAMTEGITVDAGDPAADIGDQADAGDQAATGDPDYESGLTEAWQGDTQLPETFESPAERAQKVMAKLDVNLDVFRQEMMRADAEFEAMQRDLKEMIEILLGPVEAEPEIPPVPESMPKLRIVPKPTPEWVSEMNDLLDDGVALTVEEALKIIPEQNQEQLREFFKILPDGCLGRTIRE